VPSSIVRQQQIHTPQSQLVEGWTRERAGRRLACPFLYLLSRSSLRLLSICPAFSDGKRILTLSPPYDSSTPHNTLLGSRVFRKLKLCVWSLPLSFVIVHVSCFVYSPSSSSLLLCLPIFYLFCCDCSCRCFHSLTLKLQVTFQPNDYLPLDPGKLALCRPSELCSA